VRQGSAGLAVLLLAASVAYAQQKTVAVTVDDLAWAGGTVPPANAIAINHALLSAFRIRRIPVTGFVIQKRADSLGATGSQILKDWIAEGFDLGNHTYSHPDFNDLSAEQMEDEIVRGEAAIAPLMKAAGKKLTYFRFPMNHTGDTKEKHDAVAAFLSRRGYKVATCTIDNSDYLFNDAYMAMLAKGDAASAQKLRAEYLAYTGIEIDYYAGLHKQVLGYEPPHVMLLHDNQLNADVIDEILRLFEERKYRFVSLETAQSDRAYLTPDAYVTKYGWMWGYRWAKELNVKVNGSLEKEPPQWVLDYGKPATR
jgi:peptidoglycan/xylan/chitin deacetylase (PgdA/CDA1 family)